MQEKLDGGVVFTPDSLEASEYLPNKGVFLTPTLNKGRGDGFGLYFGRIEPGSEIAREIHPETSETIIVRSGEALGFVGDAEIPLKAGQVLHVEKNVHHGIRNTGSEVLEITVIGHPDF